MLAGESNLRKDFPETPRGADRVVMGVVSFEGEKMVPLCVVGGGVGSVARFRPTFVRSKIVKRRP